jgi:hypothetical protein
MTDVVKSSFQLFILPEIIFLRYPKLFKNCGIIQVSQKKKAEPLLTLLLSVLKASFVSRPVPVR